jgi:RNA polymerase sigma-70 factor (ECF subfamily)
MDFNKIINENKSHIKSIIRSITGEENEDLEQDVSLKIWKNSQKYEEKGSLKSWISTIVRNTSLDYIKSSYRKTSLNSTSDDYIVTSIQDSKESPENKVINLERRKKIIQAIDKLKPKFKQVIMICEIQGYSYEECAKKLRCPLGTVKSRIYNAKKELSIELQDLL